MKGFHKRLLIILLIFLPLYIFSIFIAKTPQIPEDFIWSDVVFASDDRILICAPHPDDELLGCGGIIQHAVEMGLPVHIVFLTYGDANEWSFMVYRERPVVSSRGAINMGLVRHEEALKSASILGLSKDNLTFLGYPDFGTLNIWYKCWNNSPPYKSILTRVTQVPYNNALRAGALYKGDDILKDIKTVIKTFKPTKIFVTSSADHHPDHQALFLFTSIALMDLENDLTCTIYPYLIHYNNWPYPSGYLPEKFLHPPEALVKEIRWQDINLTPEQIEVKHNALKAYVTQYKSNKKYLLSFIRSNELFGDMPFVTLKSDLIDITGKENEKNKIPDELLEKEKSVYVGIQEEYVKLKENCIEIKVKFSRPLAKTVGLSLYLFGYRSDKDFPLMPKLHIKFGAVYCNIYDQNKKLPVNILQFKRSSREITISVDLADLDNPEKIFFSTRTYVSKIPLDWSPWRILNINK
jgi:LmbE family N-acetylglucosaminyl deacetylase